MAPLIRYAPETIGVHLIASLISLIASLIRYAPETIGVHLPVPPAEGGEPLEQKVCALGSSHGTGDRLLAVGDLFQQLRLHRYPCLQPPSTAERNDDEGRGHASALSSVRFSYKTPTVLCLACKCSSRRPPLFPTGALLVQ